MKYYKEEIKQNLENKGIQYRILEHPAVYTMAEMEQLGIFREGRVCKNLFLRDQKGKQHFLVSLPEEKQVDLKDLGEKLGGQRLSFASEERLQKYLGCILPTPNAPGQRVFSRCAAPFFLEIRQYSCGKMSCSAQKLLAAGHIGSWKNTP